VTQTVEEKREASKLRMRLRRAKADGPIVNCPDRPCARCGEAPRDISSYCYSCHNKNGYESKEQNGGYRNYHLRLRYGITAEEVDRLIEKQNGVCPICQTEPNRWHVDHDHATGEVRGMLCHHCNTALGNLRDDVKRLERAIAHLRGEL
jgi:hypothetical protein